MFEVLKNFESVMGGAERLSPAVLVGPGVAALVVGLFVWLGGLGFKKIVAGIAGAIGGGILGAVVLGWAALSAAGASVVAAIAAAVFEKVSITALAAALATAIGIAFFIGPYVEITPAPGSRAESPTEVTILSVGRSVAKVKSWAVDVGGAIRKACSLMPGHKWAIAAVLGLIFIACGSFFWRPTAALYFSAVGTILVFAGMILLLFNKGVMPVSRICRRPSVYSAVFAAMVVFGMAEQLILCRGAKAQSAKKGAGKNANKTERR